MRRDSLFGDAIEWSGRPKVLSVPPVLRVAAAASAIVSAVALCFSIVVATALRVRVDPLLAFSAWCALLAVASWRLPLWWQSGQLYLVTDKHVIARRGRFRRTIDRWSISYALVRWNPNVPGTGDLVLVRAVPTGALRRTLTLTLSDVEAPDRLWATIRGVEASRSLGDGTRPLAQRLDGNERVLWSGAPLASRWTPRRALSVAGATVSAMALVRGLVQVVPVLQRVARAHSLPPVALGLLLSGCVLGFALLATVAVSIAYEALLRPAELLRRTRYLVTDRRVLIRRGNEELSLDRSRIAYVIDAPVGGLTDVFLVLDGPQARALAPSGAFGEAGGGALRPVISAIEDAETVGAILREGVAGSRLCNV